MKEHLKKKEFGLDKVKEIVTLELVGGVMNTLQNNEVINVDTVAQVYPVYMLYTKYRKCHLISS